MSSQETTVNIENKKQKRQKIVKACNDCRRRKVKCDGGQPCSTCRRSAIPCVFESSTPKRGATKHYIESLENRINVIERALSTLDNPTMNLVKEAMFRQQLIEDGTLQPQPQDRLLRQDSFTTTSSSSPKSISSNFTKDDNSEPYIQFFMSHIQPHFPLFVPSYFQQELPSILIYAVCTLSAHFLNSNQAEVYYHKVMLLFDDAMRPSIHLIQTYLILIKYMEVTVHPSLFFDKTKYLMARAMDMCKILDLVNVMDLDWEIRKRTLCMVYCYHTLICTEQGIEPNQTVKDQELLLPSIFPNETTIECYRHILMMTYSLSQVQQHLIKVSQQQVQVKDVIQENMDLLQLSMMIENNMMQIPPHLQYKDDTMSSMTRLLHMLYHLNIILLHHHYYMQQETSYNHRQISLSSASAMTRLVEGLLREPTGNYRYTPRGIYWVAYCITAALKVLGMEQLQDMTYMNEYQRCHKVAQRVQWMQQETMPEYYSSTWPKRSNFLNMTQSCQDLKSLFAQHRIASTVSSRNSNAPYLYPEQPIKVRRIRKSQSIHGLFF